MTDDIGALVSKILEHPELVEQVTALLREDNGKETAQETIPDAAETTAGAAEDRSDNGAGDYFLRAIRPFLSERRARALDTFCTVRSVIRQAGGRGRET